MFGAVKDWAPPIATVLAVIVGGLGTFLVQHHLEIRRQRAFARAGARVLQSEIFAVARLIDAAGKTGSWRHDGQAVIEAWRESRSTLAGHLTADEWGSVSRVVTGLTLLRSARVGDEGPAGAERLVTLAGDAYRQLERLADTGHDSRTT